jgi:hypothetical protein
MDNLKRLSNSDELPLTEEGFDEESMLIRDFLVRLHQKAEYNAKIRLSQVIEPSDLIKAYGEITNYNGT